MVVMSWQTLICEWKQIQLDMCRCVRLVCTRLGSQNGLRLCQVLSLVFVRSAKHCWRPKMLVCEELLKCFSNLEIYIVVSACVFRKWSTAVHQVRHTSVVRHAQETTHPHWRQSCIYSLLWCCGFHFVGSVGRRDINCLVWGGGFNKNQSKGTSLQFVTPCTLQGCTREEIWTCSPFLTVHSSCRFGAGRKFCQCQKFWFSLMFQKPAASTQVSGRRCEEVRQLLDCATQRLSFCMKWGECCTNFVPAVLKDQSA